MKAIVVNEVGGSDVLTVAEREIPTPKDNEVLVKVAVAGVNYIDVYYREGVYPMDPPFGVGVEGCGILVEDASNKIPAGTRVAWDNAIGSYAEYVCVPRDRLVVVPDSINDDVAGTMLLQGMTAQYLAAGVGKLGPGTSCLITAGAGGVGLLLTQFAKSLGTKVFSLVSSDEKEQLAREAGADVVLRYSDEVAHQVRSLTHDEGVDVVYDGVGKATIEQSLAAVKERGLVCLFGASSGPVDPLDPMLLNRCGSIFFTRPSLAHWTKTPEEFQTRASAVVEAITNGTLKFRVGTAYPLDEARQAHEALESRKTTGSTILRVT